MVFEALNDNLSLAGACIISFVFGLRTTFEAILLSLKIPKPVIFNLSPVVMSLKNFNKSKLDRFFFGLIIIYFLLTLRLTRQSSRYSSIICLLLKLLTPL